MTMQPKPLENLNITLKPFNRCSLSDALYALSKHQPSSQPLEWSPILTKYLESEHDSDSEPSSQEALPKLTALTDRFNPSEYKAKIKCTMHIMIILLSLIGGFYFNYIPLDVRMLAFAALLLCMYVYDQIMQYLDQTSNLQLPKTLSPLDRISGTFSIIIMVGLELGVILGAIHLLLALLGTTYTQPLGIVCCLSLFFWLSQRLGVQMNRLLHCSIKGQTYLGYGAQLNQYVWGPRLSYLKSGMDVFRNILSVVVISQGVLFGVHLNQFEIILFSILSLSQLYEAFLFTQMWYKRGQSRSLSLHLNRQERYQTLKDKIKSYCDDIKAKKQSRMRSVLKGLFSKWTANIIGWPIGGLFIMQPIFATSLNYGALVIGITLCACDLFNRFICADFLYGQMDKVEIMKKLTPAQKKQLKEKVPLQPSQIIRSLLYRLMMVGIIFVGVWVGKNKFYRLFSLALPMAFSMLSLDGVEVYALCLSIVFILIPLFSNLFKQDLSKDKYDNNFRLDYCLTEQAARYKDYLLKKHIKKESDCVPYLLQAGFAIRHVKSLGLKVDSEQSEVINAIDLRYRLLSLYLEDLNSAYPSKSTAYWERIHSEYTTSNDASLEAFWKQVLEQLDQKNRELIESKTVADSPPEQFNSKVQLTQLDSMYYGSRILVSLSILTKQIAQLSLVMDFVYRLPLMQSSGSLVVVLIALFLISTDVVSYVANAASALFYADATRYDRPIENSEGAMPAIRSGSLPELRPSPTKKENATRYDRPIENSDGAMLAIHSGSFSDLRPSATQKENAHSNIKELQSNPGL